MDSGVCVLCTSHSTYADVMLSLPNFLFHIIKGLCYSPLLVSCCSLKCCWGTHKECLDHPGVRRFSILPLKATEPRFERMRGTRGMRVLARLTQWRPTSTRHDVTRQQREMQRGFALCMFRLPTAASGAKYLFSQRSKTKLKGEWKYLSSGQKHDFKWRLITLFAMSILLDYLVPWQEFLM